MFWSLCTKSSCKDLTLGQELLVIIWADGPNSVRPDPWQLATSIYTALTVAEKMFSFSLTLFISLVSNLDGKIFILLGCLTCNCQGWSFKMMPKDRYVFVGHVKDQIMVERDFRSSQSCKFLVQVSSHLYICPAPTPTQAFKVKASTRRAGFTNKSCIQGC